MRILTISAMLALAIGLGACARHTTPIVAPEAVGSQDRQFEAVYQASLDVLKRYYFRPDRQDRRSAIITTFPMTGQYPLEFWRRDAVTRFSLAENTLQTIYLVATVNIEPDSAGGYLPTVRVDLSRSNYPSPHVTTSSEAYSMFAMVGGYNRWVTDFGPHQTVAYHDENLLDEEIARRNEELLFAEVGYRTPLGRFEALEQRLAQEIQELANLRLMQ